MSVNGQANGTQATSHVLAWPRRVLSMADVQRNLNGHREVLLGPGTVVTPLADEELRQRGVRLARQEPAHTQTRFGYGQDRPHGLVASAVRTLTREGLGFRELPEIGDRLVCRWAQAVAECLASGACAGGVLFCEEAGLAACVANKIGGLRAVPVTTVAQAARATLSLAANLLIVEMPGRTFFEILQILRTLAGSVRSCPEGVACTLQELDGHAHR